MKNIPMRSYLYLLVIILLTHLSKAQQPSGMKVLIKDKQSGLPMSNTTFTVILNDTVSQICLSDSGGWFFVSRPQGKYTISVAHQDYMTSLIYNITVGEQKTAYLIFDLTENKKRKKGVKLKKVKD